MMTREQIERIAENCGVGVSYTDPGKGGFVINSSKIAYESVNDIFMRLFETTERTCKRYSINEAVLLAV